MQNKNLKNYNRSKSEILRLLWDIVVFRLVAQLLNMVCLIIQLLYEISFKYFLVLFWHSFISISRNRNIRWYFIYNVQNLRFSGFSLYPLSFFTVPLRNNYQWCRIYLGLLLMNYPFSLGLTQPIQPIPSFIFPSQSL